MPSWGTALGEHLLVARKHCGHDACPPRPLHSTHQASTQAAPHVRSRMAAASATTAAGTSWCGGAACKCGRNPMAGCNTLLTQATHNHTTHGWRGMGTTVAASNCQQQWRPQGAHSRFLHAHRHAARKHVRASTARPKHTYTLHAPRFLAAPQSRTTTRTDTIAAARCPSITVLRDM